MLDMCIHWTVICMYVCLICAYTEQLYVCMHAWYVHTLSSCLQILWRHSFCVLHVHMYVCKLPIKHPEATIHNNLCVCAYVLHKFCEGIVFVFFMCICMYAKFLSSTLRRPCTIRSRQTRSQDVRKLPYIFTHIQIHTHMYVYTHIHVCIYTHTYVCIYTHTHATSTWLNHPG
jgi:hypothetical protein